MTRLAPLILLTSALLSTAATCESDLIEDPGFQLWCGDRLCAWDLEQGEIRKVATWHTHDYGVELVGSPVLLSHDPYGSASMVRFEVVSDIEQSAMVTVQVDREGDGVIDWAVQVPSSDGFISRTWRSDVGVHSDGVIYLRKSGEGRAVVARLRATRD